MCGSGADVIEERVAFGPFVGVVEPQRRALDGLIQSDETLDGSDSEGSVRSQTTSAMCRQGAFSSVR